VRVLNTYPVVWNRAALGVGWGNGGFIEERKGIGEEEGV